MCSGRYHWFGQAITGAVVMLPGFRQPRLRTRRRLSVGLQVSDSAALGCFNLPNNGCCWESPTRQQSRSRGRRTAIVPTRRCRGRRPAENSPPRPVTGAPGAPRNGTSASQPSRSTTSRPPFRPILATLADHRRPWHHRPSSAAWAAVPAD